MIEFAAKLRSKGIDAWLDRWEMLPGDSLIDKLFEEGIKNASAVVVVLSEFSVKKPWVREELNAAAVKRIEDGSLLIPVVIDECEIPEVLKSTLWVKIEDLDAYAEELESILAAIFGRRDKPPLGKPPAYAASAQIGSLEKIDSLVLAEFGRAAIERSGKIGLSTQRVWEEVARNDVARSDFLESLEILVHQGYIKKGDTIGQPPPHFSLTHLGFESYLESGLNGYSQIKTSIISSIVNEGEKDNKQLAARLDCPQAVVNQVLEDLERRGHVRLRKVLGGRQTVKTVSPGLRRALRDGGEA